jgi:hypothetical protein
MRLKSDFQKTSRNMPSRDLNSLLSLKLNRVRCEKIE